MRKILPLLCVLAAGCSGGPLKELPVFEPPPPEPEIPAPAPEPSTSAAPASEPELPRLLGAWSSVALLGPGSASLRRIVLVFDDEGGFSAAGFGATKTAAYAGAYREMDGAVEVDAGDGLRLWPMELGLDTLTLRDGERELRLTRLR